MEKRKKLLIVVDYQNDFVCGTLGFPKAEQLEGAISAKIQQYRREGSDILFTLDTHYDDYLTTQEGKRLPISHCVDQSEGWHLYGDVETQRKPEDVTISKHSFGSLDLADYLTSHLYDRIELVGVVTNICVIANAIIAKTAQPEAEIVIDAGCVAGNDEALNNKALDVMAGLQMTIINRD